MKKSMGIALAAIMTLSALAPCGMISDSLSVSIEAAEVNLSAPTGLKANVSGSVITLSWNKVKGAEKYRIYIYDTKNGKYKKYKEVTGAECVLSNLPENSIYYIKVAAVKNGKAGARSKNIKAVTGSSAPKWVNEYKSIIRDHKGSVAGCCSLYDVTGDGIPELFISDGNAHANGVEIYSYNGKIVRHFSHKGYNDGTYYTFGSYGTVYYCPEKNCIIDVYAGQGSVNTTVFSFIGDNLKEEVRLEDNSLFGFEPLYQINRNEASKKEYKEIWSKYDGETVTLGRTFIIRRSEEYKDDRMEMDEVWSKILNEGWTGYDDLSTSNDASILINEGRYANVN